MSRYAVSNSYLADLLDDGRARPKLRLILRARAKRRNSSFVSGFATLYRQFGEDVGISDAQRAILEEIAAGPVQNGWR
ncbi:MAG TPA: hypothetical protein VGR45_01775 [Stellaceae bacterium]|nr:hypothetical protein [Stellaceae bacterium]